jgi:hypothetical protein
MPCVSRITETKIILADRLEQALNELGIKILSKNATRITTDIGEFTRTSATQSFGFVGNDEKLKNVGMKYAELSVKAWAKKTGFSVTAKTGNKMTLKNRSF